MYELTSIRFLQRNILVNDKGEACIADFGLSRRQGVIDEVKGTPYYMARELLSYEYCGGSVPPITAASDVWAFGMTCLEVRSSVPHFANRSDKYLNADSDTHRKVAVLLGTSCRCYH
jgi:serine/threonine protein kinase